MDTVPVDSISQSKEKSNTFDEKSLEDRHALPEDTDTTKPKKIMTVGEVEKFIANNARGKVYSKKSSFDILERFIGINEMKNPPCESRADFIFLISRVSFRELRAPRTFLRELRRQRARRTS